MAYCTNCGTKLPDGAKFCFECGEKIVKTGSAFKNKREVVYDGAIHKCPNCGEIIDSFKSRCPSCGYEIRDIKLSNTIEEFAKKVDKSKNDVETVEIIKNFIIPNTREDILEFMILASTNINVYLNDNDKRELKSAWILKLEQAYQKSKAIFNEDSELLKVEKIYRDTYQMIDSVNKKKRSSSVFHIAQRTIGLWSGLLILILAFIIDLVSYSNTSIYHLAGGILLILGAVNIRRNSEENYVDVAVAVFCGIISVLLGTILQEVFYRNGSVMELAGGLSIIIAVARRIKLNTHKK